MKKRHFTSLFPIQLLLIHIKSYPTLIGTWLFVSLLITGNIGSTYGMKYLFLTPEYLGEVNFLSFLFVGMTFGALFISWNMATYILHAYKFPFLATLNRPFLKYILNNSILPLTFILIYFVASLRMQWNYEFWSMQRIAVNVLGASVGAGISLLIAAIYFPLTNKDIFAFIKKEKNKPPHLGKNIAPGQRGVSVYEAIQDDRALKVSYYLNGKLKWRKARSAAHYDPKLVLKIFNQHHQNVFVVQMVGVFALIGLGYLVEYPVFRIPTAASIFILASVFVTIVGAISYWLHQWRWVFLIVFLLILNALTRHVDVEKTNKAYGLDYDTKIPYTEAYLNEKMDSTAIANDKANTITLLNNWRSQFKTSEQPKMVLFCASGGGVRAAVWSMHVLQQLDETSQGALMKHTVLMSGASGGMLGSAYWRSLVLADEADRYKEKQIKNIGGDLLNAVSFSLVTNDLFLPGRKFESNGQEYRLDRGYIFENQLNENTNGFLNKKVMDFKQAEQAAQVPMMVISPTVVNDGRRALISAQGVSYLARPLTESETPQAVEWDAFDFNRLFKEAGSDDLNLLTALRMNATYPYILPNTHLPTSPDIEVMDAGFRDNFGQLTAFRFIQVFKNWIKENTSGVIVINLRGDEKIETLTSKKDGLLERAMNPLGVVANIMSVQDYEQDALMSFAEDVLGAETPLEIVRFTYAPSSNHERASMNFHLTARERKDVLNALYLPRNKKGFDKIVDLLE